MTMGCLSTCNMRVAFFIVMSGLVCVVLVFVHRLTSPCRMCMNVAVQIPLDRRSVDCGCVVCSFWFGYLGRCKRLARRLVECCCLL